MNRDDLRLCYVRIPAAYFTTQPLAAVWGDDWDDAPYDLNAGPPYSRGYEMVKVFFDGPLEEANSAGSFTVEQINLDRIIPWLWKWETGRRLSIFAGATLREFVESVHAAGGDVYLPIGKEVPR